jgi:hypothetical protein
VTFMRGEPSTRFGKARRQLPRLRLEEPVNCVKAKGQVSMSIDRALAGGQQDRVGSIARCRRRRVRLPARTPLDGRLQGR